MSLPVANLRLLIDEPEGFAAIQGSEVFMAKSSTDLPHDFADRMMRETLSQPANLRELVGRVIPDLAPQLDFPKMKPVPRTFLLDDYRERESDLLFEIPFLEAPGRLPLLLCLLLEHQSSVDDVMPLRLLLYAVLYWERQWRQWASDHQRGQRLRLTPVVPILFYTGNQPWDGSRSLADLFEADRSIQAFVPQWPTWLCDLTQFDPAELVQRPEALWQALAVVRGEQAERDAFFALFQQALQRLEPVAGIDRPRWDQLQRLVLYWTYYRRSKADRLQALNLALSTQAGVLLRQEIDDMTKQLEMSYEQELILESKKKGREEATTEMVDQQREILRGLIKERFTTIPEAVLQRIVAADKAKLDTALKQILRVHSPEELPL